MKTKLLRKNDYGENRWKTRKEEMRLKCKLNTFKSLRRELTLAITLRHSYRERIEKSLGKEGLEDIDLAELSDILLATQLLVLKHNFLDY